MPKRADLRSILIIGSGPIRIGQGCEFDYSASQACRVLRREGLRVVLVNSNPATIMTDPEWADATYIEPLDLETVTEVIAAERPDALLPTLGGQTALNLAVELHEAGVLAEYGVELLGASVDAIRRAEDRLLFRDAMIAAGLQVPVSEIVTSGCLTPGHVRAPAIVRPAFTLGGSGGGIARTPEELEERIATGLAASPVGQVLVEESLEGWQEFELEVMCDAAGNCVVVCSIENLDPMGVHTGDSWTVAPQQTLPDAEYQRLREAAFDCARAIGVATGGANVQFAYEPETRELRVIEMNPRVSRSSALASKATGFPIAKIAALLAIGYTLDELPNDITQQTTAAFEPALDYVAVKAPRFDFEKFPEADDRLGSEMRAVGESLGLGRTFPEAFLKALHGREIVYDTSDLSRRGEPVPDRWDLLLEAARQGLDLPGIHSYFADGLREIAAAEQLPPREAARFGVIKGTRTERGLPGRLAVDSCAAEFEAQTPYFYLSYEPSDTELPTDGEGGRRPRLGAEPHRAGNRVRLLLRPRGEHVPRARVRGSAREPEPGDGVDRLRHLRPPLSRAADARAHARRVRARAAAWRRRVVRRADTAEARTGTRRCRRAVARRSARCDRRGRGPGALRPAARRPGPERTAVARGRQRGRGAQLQPRSSATPCWSDRIT